VQSGHSFAGIRLSIWEAVIQRPRGRATSLWVLNALNIADAWLTTFALREGVAIEANPVVRVIGMPGKVALVAVAGWLLYMLRPRAVLVPIVAFSLVVLWTSVNLVAV
jgi:hypothetical protein